MSYGTPNFVICTESDFGLEIHMDCSCIVVSNSDSQEFLCNAYSSIYRLRLKMNPQGSSLYTIICHTDWVLNYFFLKEKYVITVVSNCNQTAQLLQLCNSPLFCLIKSGLLIKFHESFNHRLKSKLNILPHFYMD